MATGLTLPPSFKFIRTGVNRITKTTIIAITTKNFFFIQSHSFAKSRFICPLKSKSFNPRRKLLMPDAALEDLAVRQLCAFAARHKVPDPFAGPRGRALHRNFSIVGINVHLTYSADCQESDSLCSDGSEDCCRLRLIPLTRR